MAYMAIETKFLGPTDHRGSRIKAFVRDAYSDSNPQSVTIGYRHDLNGDANHEAAAQELLPKVCSSPDTVRLYKGATGRGYVFVVVPIERRLHDASI